MKKLFILLSLLSLFVSQACKERNESLPQAGKTPPLKLVDRLGNGYSLTDITKGSDYTILVLADWHCPYCLAAVKDLYKGYGKCEVKFIMGGSATPPQSLMRNLSAKQLENFSYYRKAKVYSSRASLRIFPDAVENWKGKFDLVGTPTFILVDKAGHYVTSDFTYSPMVDGKASERFSKAFDSYCFPEAKK